MFTGFWGESGHMTITANYYKWCHKSYVEPEIVVAAYEGVTASSYSWYWRLSKVILGILTMRFVCGRHYGEGSNVNLPGIGIWFSSILKQLFLDERKLKTLSWLSWHIWERVGNVKVHLWWGKPNCMFSHAHVQILYYIPVFALASELTRVGMMKCTGHSCVNTPILIGIQFH